LLLQGFFSEVFKPQQHLEAAASLITLNFAHPLAISWCRVVEDYRDALKWMNTPGTLGHDSNTSWEVWWEEEQVSLLYVKSRVC
jgi:hypothetical protein